MNLFNLYYLFILDHLNPNTWSCQIQKNLSSWSEPSGSFGSNSEECARHHQLLHLSPRHGGHHFQGMKCHYVH